MLVVIQTGSAVIPFRWDKDAEGIIQQWYSGEAGGRALADILFGKVNPSGKLSETFVRRERTDLDYPGDGRKVYYQEGQFAGYRYYDIHPEDVWYPFGYGLSYTEFAYRDLELEEKENGVEVRFRLQNTGDIDGKEAAQIYIRDPESTVVKPYKVLGDFVKVQLAAGEEKEVALTLEWDRFAYYNTMLKKWIVEPGEYEILVGASCTDIRLAGSIRLKGDDAYTVITVKDVPWQT